MVSHGNNHQLNRTSIDKKKMVQKKKKNKQMEKIIRVPKL